MPVNITASNGQTFHLFQLPDLSAPEPEDMHEFTTLENELIDGYRSRKLLGLDTGIRSWKLNLPTLAGASVIPAAVVDPYGVTVSREQYVRNVYKYNKTTGIPIAYQNGVGGQYYLVDIMDDSLAMQKSKGVNLYASSVSLRQRRLNGVTIFDPLKLNPLLWYDNTSHGSGVWNNKSTLGAFSLTANGDVVFSANPQNGLNTVRLSGTTSNGVLQSFNLNGVYDIFIVMKMREATFSNNAGIYTGTSSDDRLVGTSGGTKFQNYSIGGLEYYKDGVSYLVTNQQAPMNTFGIVQIRSATTDLGTTSAMQFGLEGGTLGTYAKVDFAEIIVAPLLSRKEDREITEYLKIKWSVP